MIDAPGYRPAKTDKEGNVIGDANLSPEDPNSLDAKMREIFGPQP